MTIKRFLTPYMRSYCYVVIEGNSAVIIDPCELNEIKQLMNEIIQDTSLCILTHEHYDHISGLDWMHLLGIPVIASESCNKSLGSPKLNQSRYFDLFCILQKRLEGDLIPEVKEYRGYADKTFKSEMSFEWRGHNFFLKETPGHSKGSICILVDDVCIFSGDTLFADRETNCSILGGNVKQLRENSIPWIRSLDKNLTVYPGHYEVFKLGEHMGGKMT